MSDLFAYDEGVAEGASSDLLGVAGGIESSLDELSGFVGRVQSQWEGDEMHTYQAIQSQWNTAADTIREILRQMTGSLENNTGLVRDMRTSVRGAITR
ncbi:WXG100 family type VII secretion target [Nocardia huaxiensis]|uniref:WXG100 family type VII secretion target n=1 Tax=Nocardia huaxiensis TaxID=2755382 RepID=A0A7D6VM97_9NOCA|nr:WXG100 family type VII secretion target [Nocardia huaxiensis]QLY32850.1 WXG100 family type VII secretion target [Nocardia huaxiensis]UFS93394.1 WXG100 family type VII secretion target [Nocardia huaxiensis]